MPGKAPTPPSLSAKGYGVMALIALLIGIGLLVFYVEVVPKLPPSVRNQVYYIVLLPFAIACAVVLFGALRSYARLTAKHPGIALELGGPVVLIVLILFGGFKLVPPPGDTFDLTVRAHSADESVPVIKSGSVTLELDNNRATRSFAPDGEADFKGIPAKFSGTTIRILAQVDGYEEKWQEHKVEGNSLDLSLERIRPRPVTYQGFVQDEQGNPLSGVQVTSPDCDQQASTDAKGTFIFHFSVTPESRCHMVFTKDGYAPYNTDMGIHVDGHDRFLLRRSK